MDTINLANLIFFANLQKIGLYHDGLSFTFGDLPLRCIDISAQQKRIIIAEDSIDEAYFMQLTDNLAEGPVLIIRHEYPTKCEALIETLLNRGYKIEDIHLKKCNHYKSESYGQLPEIDKFEGDEERLEQIFTSVANNFGFYAPDKLDFNQLITLHEALSFGEITTLSEIEGYLKDRNKHNIWDRFMEETDQPGPDSLKTWILNNLKKK